MACLRECRLDVLHTVHGIDDEISSCSDVNVTKQTNPSGGRKDGAIVVAAAIGVTRDRQCVAGECLDLDVTTSSDVDVSH